MKPIFRSFFSSGPFSWAMACRLVSAPAGKAAAMAAIALRLPTAFRKVRRTGSCGKMALTNVASMNSLL